VRKRIFAKKESLFAQANKINKEYFPVHLNSQFLSVKKSQKVVTTHYSSIGSITYRNSVGCRFSSFCI